LNLGKEGAVPRFRLVPLLSLFLALTAPGCVAFYSTRPVEVTVLDPGSEEPVYNVPVSVKYHQIMVLNPPEAVHGTTDQSGVVVLRMANFENGVIEVLAGDTKFLLTGKMVRKGGVFKDGQLHWRSKDPAPFELRLTPH